MPHLIKSNNCLTAWRDACWYIIQNGNGFNLIVHIDNPLLFTDLHLSEITNSKIISSKNLSDVINTIFPTKLHLRSNGLDNSQFYDLHEELYNRGKTMHPRNKGLWGNYFLRFTKFGEKTKNQLQKIIDDINSRNNQYAACYIMHVSSADTDSNTRNIGNPCLQYIQFGQVGNTVNLTAVYRNHDFLTKALGNYIGLSKLLEFVCLQTGRNVGTFACHSIHYFLDSKRNVQNSLNNLTW
jgi:thymidylate synthase